MHLIIYMESKVAQEILYHVKTRLGISHITPNVGIVFGLTLKYVRPYISGIDTPEGAIIYIEEFINSFMSIWHKLITQNSHFTWE